MAHLVEQFKNSLNVFKTVQPDGVIYPLMVSPFENINENILFDTLINLKILGKVDKLNVLLYSYGGDAHSAFHVGRILQAYAKELVIYVLREAKSAATIIACAGDKIIFSDISALGPVDPQIKNKQPEGKDKYNRTRFSPLAIKHMFEMLHKESAQGHNEIVSILADKLPEPLILGELLKSLETSKDYLGKLMQARMLVTEKPARIKEIAEKLVTGYPDHGYCIDYLEAKSCGLKVEMIADAIDFELFEIMKSYKDICDEIGRNLGKPEGEQLLNLTNKAIKIFIHAQSAIADKMDADDAEDVGPLALAEAEPSDSDTLQLAPDED